MSSAPSATEVHINPSRVDPAAWKRASRALIAQLEDPHDPTALGRRIAETHNNATRGFAEPPTDPAALDAADLYAYLTEI